MALPTESAKKKKIGWDALQCALLGEGKHFGGLLKETLLLESGRSGQTAKLPQPQTKCSVNGRES